MNTIDDAIEYIKSYRHKDSDVPAHASWVIDKIYDEYKKFSGSLSFDEYQKQAFKTMSISNFNKKTQFLYSALGLCSEAGEVADKIKKLIRDEEENWRDFMFFMGEKSAPKDVIDFRKKLALELGDVLWYVAAIATCLCINLNDVASENLKKLESRAARGKIGGSGDYR